MPIASSRCAVAVAGSLVALFFHAAAAVAAEGDKEGWSVRTDYPKPRAFLIWVPLSDGPRVLAIDCVPGNAFNVASEDVTEDMAGKPATLTLANGHRRYDIGGEIIKNAGSGEVSFRAALQADPKSLQSIAAKLMPVLENAGRISYAFGAGTGPAAQPSTPGSIGALSARPQALKSFKAVCFGIR